MQRIPTEDQDIIDYDVDYVDDDNDIIGDNDAVYIHQDVEEDHQHQQQVMMDDFACVSPTTISSSGGSSPRSVTNNNNNGNNGRRHSNNQHNSVDRFVDEPSSSSTNNNNIVEDPFEAASLMTTSTNEDGEEELEEEGVRSFRILIGLMVLFLCVAAFALLLPGIFSKSDHLESLRTPAKVPVTYDCPEVYKQQTSTDEHGYLKPPDFENDYQNITNQITDNITEFLSKFREEDYDEWGKSYDVVKQGMYHWKSTKYPDYLKDGDSIYESACGIGLNLYMTLEILQEIKGIENLFVYGSDFRENSAAKADAVFTPGNNIAPARSQKGFICPGDSTDLYFVPSDSFDLVYTGYISPILDPLHFGKTTNENYGHYTSLCKTTTNDDDDTDDWKGQKLNQMAQDIQNHWYAKWISEMTRIAKPGVPVIVEQVSPPYCNAFFDWGGVSRGWFTDAVVNNTYGWNIQPDSLEFEDDTIFRERYHVFMLKKEAEHTAAAAAEAAAEDNNKNAGGGSANDDTLDP